MGKKSGPKAPDPRQTAQEQAKLNKEAILASALINRYNTVGPSGSTQWLDASGKPVDPSKTYSPEQMAGWTQQTTLGKTEQKLKDLFDQKALRAGRALEATPFGLAGAPEVGGYSTEGFYGIPRVQRGDAYAQDVFTGLEGEVPGMDTSGLRDLDRDYSADAEKVERATYDRLMGLLNPDLAKAREREENRLAVMGHAPGGEGYGWEKDRLDRRDNEARLNAALESVGAGRAEQSRLFGIDAATRQAQLDALESQFGADVTGRQLGLSEALAASESANRAHAQDMQDMMAEHSAGMQDRANQEREMLNMFTRQDQLRDRYAQEKLATRNQRRNELAQILGSGQALPMPAAPQSAQYQMAPPDYIGLANQAFQTEAQNDMSKKGGLMGLAGTLGGAAIPAFWG